MTVREAVPAPGPRDPNEPRQAPGAFDPLDPDNAVQAAEEGNVIAGILARGEQSSNLEGAQQRGEVLAPSGRG